MSIVTGSCAPRSRAAALSARVALKRCSPMVIWILILVSSLGGSLRVVLGEVVGLLLTGAARGAGLSPGSLSAQPAPTTPTAATVTAVSTVATGVRDLVGEGIMRVRSPDGGCQRVSRT